jgi:hypothetical protein
LARNSLFISMFYIHEDLMDEYKEMTGNLDYYLLFDDTYMHKTIQDGYDTEHD